MDLTVEKILTLLPAVGTLSRVRMPYALARRITKVHIWLRSECETAAKRESELVKLHKGEYDPRTGANRFDDKAEAEAFSKELEELLKTGIDFPFEKLDLRAVSDRLDLAPGELACLDEIALFESGDEL